MLNEKLRKIRKEKRFSQHDIAKHLNISQTHYFRKERGEITFNDDEWERIAKLLNVEIEIIKENNKTETGSKNISFCAIPTYILENQSDYINNLKKEIEKLQHELTFLKQKRTSK